METKDILKKLRKDYGYSAQQVADGCDMSLGVYKKYESGERGVGTPALCKIADFYGISTDYLLDRCGGQRYNMIGDTLKRLRSERKLTLKQMGQILGVSHMTYQRYEKGDCDVSTDMLIKLAKFYHVITDYLLGLEEQKNPLAEINVNVNDKSFIETYKQFPDWMKQVFIEVMQKLTEAAQSENPVDDTEIKTFIFDMLSIHKASAGAGYDLTDGDQWQSIEVVDTPEAHEADFAVKVDGDSMLPDFEDGDIVYIVKTAEVPVGKIGLFQQDGKGYIKKAGKNHLISLNPEYDDIYGAVETKGLVIGKAELPE